MEKNEEKIYVFGHKNPDTDSICSSIVEAKMDKKNGWNAVAVRLGNINKETQFVLDYLGIKAPEMIEKVEEGQSVILVDHNEFSQSVDGIENANIEAVIDHHRIANFETSKPLYYTAKPYGCTSTILYEENLSRGYKFEKEEAILMASAIISDTLLLKSPTTTKYDIKALNELAKIADIDINKYGLDMLKAGTNLDDFTEEELINLDAKKVEKGDKKIVIAQVNTVSIEDTLKRKELLKKAICDKISNDGLDLFVLAITDILNSNSQIIALGKDTGAVEKGFNKNLEDNMMYLEGVVSRKKQILPKVVENL